MQPLGLGNKLDDYHARLFSSHDFRIDVEVLDMQEKPVGTVRIVDGQVNLQTGEAVSRTCSLTVSDPDGALDYKDSSGWSPRSVHAARLIRVRHTVEVPGVGPVTAIPFVGAPVSISRSGAEVTVECQDKASLYIRGAPPLTVKKGASAVGAIRQIMGERTGETKFRLPESKRRLGEDYSVGWTEESSPWAVASRIARRELGMQLVYSCDGHLLLRRPPGGPSLTVPFVTEAASMDVDFTALNNWVRVRGKKKTETKKDGNKTITTTTQPETTAAIKPGHALSPQSLGRNGVPRYWPLLVDDDALKKVSDTKARAARELAATDQLEAAPAFSCAPFFHADTGDLVDVVTPGGTVRVRLGEASIPLGTGGEMTVGAHRWVSARPGSKTKNRILRTRKVRRPKKKGDKK